MSMCGRHIWGAVSLSLSLSLDAWEKCKCGQVFRWGMSKSGLHWTCFPTEQVHQRRACQLPVISLPRVNRTRCGSCHPMGLFHRVELPRMNTVQGVHSCGNLRLGKRSSEVPARGTSISAHQGIGKQSSGSLGVRAHAAISARQGMWGTEVLDATCLCGATISLWRIEVLDATYLRGATISLWRKTFLREAQSLGGEILNCVGFRTTFSGSTSLFHRNSGRFWPEFRLFATRAPAGRAPGRIPTSCHFRIGFPT